MSLHQPARLFAATFVIAALLTPAIAQSPGEEPVPEGLQPLAFLIGKWESKTNGQVGAIMDFEWGPRKAYIRWTAIRILGERRIHAFQGILAHNGVSGRVEFLLPLGNGTVMEKGDFDVFSNGSLRRNIEVYYPAGTPLPPTGADKAPASGLMRRYEQMFHPVDADTVRSSVFYLSEEGTWLPSFPGAEEIVLERVESSDGDSVPGVDPATA